MTPRHVVGPGPGQFSGYCIFKNKEEVDLYIDYCDPTHDYAFVRFNPTAVKTMPLTALSLRPELAKVGLEVRTVGSILISIISQLDRDAPDYGFGYCDFNINYIQLTSTASFGSAGSPVVYIEGHGIGFITGGGNGASSHIIPLERAVRALDCVQRGVPVTRGTMQCQ